MQRMPDTKGEISINALQKKHKQTNKQNATLLHLQYLLAKIFFQNRSYAHLSLISGLVSHHYHQYHRFLTQCH